MIKIYSPVKRSRDTEPKKPAKSLDKNGDYKEIKGKYASNRT
tara:strand:- start:24 stop:149 length:126 start_codon:yes stop_codon:yes gene_type:complete